MGPWRSKYETTFAHDNENRPTTLTYQNAGQTAYTYDGIGRTSQRTVNAGGSNILTNYTYLAGGHGTGSATPLVQTITQLGKTLTYTYDDVSPIPHFVCTGYAIHSPLGNFGA